MRVVLSSILFCFLGSFLFAQEPSAQPIFAPGGLIVIPPDIDYESISSRTDIPEILARQKETDPEIADEARFNPEIWATNVRAARDVWCLEFAFKPIRIIDVDIPNTSGNLDKKKVWYLVYRVKNLGPSEQEQAKITQIKSVLGSSVPTGNEMSLPVPQDKTTLGISRSAAQEFRRQTGVFAAHPGTPEPIRFIPQFVLATHRLVTGGEAIENPDTGMTEWKAHETAITYSDSILPLALLKIKERERMAAMPETSVSIATKEIVPGQELWGVAMWTDIDPRINEFSIYVAGLTNAYIWLNENTDGEYVITGRINEETKKFDEKYVNTGQVGEGRVLKRRVLRIDWWRVGDKDSLNESQIHFGSKNGTMPESIFDKTGKLTAEEQKKLEEAKEAVKKERRKLAASLEKVNMDVDRIDPNWVSPVERAIYHLIQQDWLKPGFGYEWLFL